LAKSLEQRIDEAIREDVAIVPYDPSWPAMFTAEANNLRAMLPSALIKRIEHFGSTAVPRLAAKPVIDMLVEVTSLERTQIEIVPLLESKGYDYFWRTDVDSPYAWFIKRDGEGTRTHHVHMVEDDSVMWDRLYFRDYLRIDDEEAERYLELKLALAAKYPNDRIGYTAGKTEFVTAVTNKARAYFSQVDNRG
jgi:GrpB-like predicted nucleotidyltransferase (UPF0157 family)